MTSIDEKTNENFIMLPTVDFCFKELMKNPKVRKGFIAAVLGKEPGMIRQTSLKSYLQKTRTKKGLYAGCGS